MKLSIVIPAHNEEGCIRKTVCDLIRALQQAVIHFEILIVNDHSTDSTESILQNLNAEYSNVRYVNNPYPNGFGFAVRTGLESFSGDALLLLWQMLLMIRMMW